MLSHADDINNKRRSIEDIKPWRHEIKDDTETKKNGKDKRRRRGRCLTSRLDQCNKSSYMEVFDSSPHRSLTSFLGHAWDERHASTSSLHHQLSSPILSFLCFVCVIAAVVFSRATVLWFSPRVWAYECGPLSLCKFPNMRRHARVNQPSLSAWVSIKTSILLFCVGEAGEEAAYLC